MGPQLSSASYLFWPAGLLHRGEYDRQRLCLKSLSENYVESCFRGKGWMARRDEGASPQWGCDRGATKPAGLVRENPPSGGSFACGQRWLGCYSPLRGCSGLAALAAAKIPRRRTPRNFQTGSKVSLPGSKDAIRFVQGFFGADVIPD